MDMELFTNRITRNPLAHRKYLILEGPRAGWVMPGSMLRMQAAGFGDQMRLLEAALPINPTVAEGDTVVPLKMRESQVVEDTVVTVAGKAIRLQGGRYDDIFEWVVLPPGLPDQDKALFLLQIREHLVLHGYEEESRRRGWHSFWRDVNESAGFTLRPVPTTVQVRAKWRIGRMELGNFVRPERMADIIEGSDEFLMTHITTDHTVLLPNAAAECRCTDHARVHVPGVEATGGDSFAIMRDILRVGMKTRMELHSIEVRSVNCPYGQAL